MKSAKTRRHSGYVTPNSTIKDKRKNIINECLEPQPRYDDWQDYRDGQRDFMSDRTKMRNTKQLHRYNYVNDEGYAKLAIDRMKLKRKLEIRKAMKTRRLG